LRTPELIAHRGYTLHYPENTRPAIEAALRAGAAYVEIDVQLTADRVPVLFHDTTLERLCATQGMIRDYPLATLRTFRASDPRRFGKRFEDVAIPTLGEVVHLLRDWPKVTLFVEIKREALVDAGVDEVYRRIAAILGPIHNRAVLISFELDVLATAHRHGWPALGVVTDRWGDLDRPVSARIAPSFLFVDITSIPPTGRLARSDARLAVYEVADPTLAPGLGARGVDLIETFAIGEMREALRSD
jgi:glycerophosphoryl diester phosphodiesterase